MADCRYLISGGVGYFGARLAEHLSASGDVVVTSRKLSPERERWLAAHPHIAHAYEPPATGEFKCFVNLATVGSGEAASDPEAAQSAMQAHVETCLEFVRSGRAKQLIHVSTFHVFGSKPKAVYREGEAPNPTHPYGIAHALGERILAENGAGLPVAVVRPTNIVGAPAHMDIGPQWGLIFLDLCKQTVENRTIRLTTDGRAYRDFVTMPDALAAISMLIETEVTDPTPMNLGLGYSMRLDELAERIRSVAADVLGDNITVARGSRVDPFLDPFTVETGRLAALGWHPSLDALDDEIRRTVAMSQQ
jgi:nucleoside-diphosphate-sugar epimerase